MKKLSASQSDADFWFKKAGSMPKSKPAMINLSQRFQDIAG
ncbi:MAG: hypothetical protein Q7R91_02905 [bacterium]|nr:hypothetical protein [bacterium]